MKLRMSIPVAVTVLLLLIWLWSGGSDPTTQVSGTVRLSTGAPLSNVLVVANSETAKGSASAVTGIDGRFSISMSDSEGLPHGRYRLKIVPVPQGSLEELPVIAHERYSEFATSGFEFEVGTEKCEWDLSVGG